MESVTLTQVPAWKDFKKWWIHKVDKSESKNFSQSTTYDHHPLISSAMNVGNCVIAVIDIKSMQYIYTSPNYAHFTGWKKEDFYKDGVHYAFSRLHPDDQPGVMAFSKLINNYFQKISPEERIYYQSFWDFRIQNNSGQYFKILQQDCALKYNNDGQIEELLVFVFKIDNIISSECQHLRMTNGHENLFYKYDHKNQVTIKLQLLTPREMEIVKLIAKSNSIKQIASKLNISVNTVKSHSTNIMQKLHVNDSIEMINLLRVWSFI